MRYSRLTASWLMTLLFLLSLGSALAADREKTSPGTLLWENRGQIEPLGAGLAIAVDEDVVVASGNVCDDVVSVGSCNWFVRAHDAKTGETLWEDRLNPGRFDRSQDVVIDGDRVFASGWFQLPVVSGAGVDFVVRAYDLKRGTLLWQQQIDRGVVDIAERITARDGRVFGVGRTKGATGSNSDFAIFAFDAATGVELWESVTDVFQVDIAFTVTVDRDTVFAAGPVQNFTSLLIRAYDARTGQLLWQDEVPGGQMFVQGQGKLVTQRGLLFVAGGILTQAGDQDFIVRAYDKKTGALRWVQQLDAGGNDEALSLDVSGNRLFAGGYDACDAAFLSCSFSVRALAPKTGAVLWQDRFQATPGGDANVTAIVARGGLVFAGGNAQDAAGLYQWTLRIYDAVSGALLGTELIASGGGSSNLIGLSLAEDRLYATGTIGTSAVSGDFTVRAYHVAGTEQGKHESDPD